MCRTPSMHGAFGKFPFNSILEFILAEVKLSIRIVARKELRYLLPYMFAKHRPLANDSITVYAVSVGR